METYYPNVAKKKKTSDYLTSYADEDFGLGVSGDDLNAKTGTTDESSLFGSITKGAGELWDGATSFLGKAFGSTGSSGGTSSGFDMAKVGSLAQGIGSVWDAYASSQYKDKIVSMEEDRVNREVAKQKKAQDAFDKVWA